MRLWQMRIVRCRLFLIPQQGRNINRDWRKPFLFYKQSFMDHCIYFQPEALSWAHFKEVFLLISHRCECVRYKANSCEFPHIFWNFSQHVHQRCFVSWKENGDVGLSRRNVLISRVACRPAFCSVWSLLCDWKRHNNSIYRSELDSHGKEIQLPVLNVEWFAEWVCPVCCPHCPPKPLPSFPLQYYKIGDRVSTFAPIMLSFLLCDHLLMVKACPFPLVCPNQCVTSGILTCQNETIWNHSLSILCCY